MHSDPSPPPPIYTNKKNSPYIHKQKEYLAQTIRYHPLAQTKRLPSSNIKNTYTNDMGKHDIANVLDQDEGTLPTVQDPFPAAQYPVDLETDENTIKAINLKTMQYTFVRIGGAWDQASTIDEVCKLALVTSKMLKERMDFLRLPYGHRDSKEKETFAVPID